MATSINTLKSWFTTGKFPTQAQFWAWLDSFRHKDDAISVEEISGLNNLLDLKADAESVTNHKNDVNAHAQLFESKADLVAGKVPASQLPSYVDDVLEFTNLAAFPATGETGKIYVALDANKTYRWGGTAYIEISSPLPSKIINTTTYNSLSTTVEQVLSTTLIPANTFKDLDAVQLKGLFIKETEVSDVVLRIYINTSNSLVGANQFYKTGGAEFRTLNSILVDSVIAKIIQAKIKGSFQTGSGAYLSALFNSSVYNVTEFDFNPTIDNYLITTVHLSSSSDVIKQESLIFSKIN